MLAEQTAAVCPECGTRIEGGFSSNLGRCMICLLRVGFDEPVEPDETLLAGGGDRLGNYRIERRDDGSLWELGRGAMGVTYRALDTSLRRAVALKLIDSEWVKRGAEARERFMREARAAAALRHPNVAAVHHFGIREENGQCFCAMELIEGETLEMRVRRTGPLDPLTTLEIALQVASALAAAEKQGLVHRDLKPGNLMLVESETEGIVTVKVIDFGVAKALAEKPDAMGLTHGAFVGTPAFASPEQFTNAPVDVRSDIYSLGATLWYLLTGHMPFPGASVDEIRARQHLHVLPIEQLKAARVPNRFISLLVSMLAAEPAARPGVRILTSKLQECRAQILDRWKTVRRFAIAAWVIGLGGAMLVLLRLPPERAAPGDSALSVSAPAKSIAVLPFGNLSQDPENTFFVGGVQDEILTNLAKIADLKVISRTSIMQYKPGPGRNLREIGKDLGVAHVLEGSVQRDAKRVRINVQLIDARTDAHLWAQTYDRDLADVFALQSEIAKTIADQLQARLSPTEKAALEKQPTANLAAFDLYTRAKSLRFTSNFSKAFEKSNLLQAVDLLNDAVARDPAFFLAWCELSVAHGNLYSSGYDRTPARLALADTTVQTALRLRPDAGEAHLYLAHHLYAGHLDYDRARAELFIAQRTLPNHPLTFQLAGNIDERQGRWSEAVRNLERAVELDPRNFNLLRNVGWVYHALRRYEEMVAVLDRALAIVPQDRRTMVNRGLAELDWRADVRPLRATVAAILAEEPAAAGAFANTSMLIALCERDLAGAARALVAFPGSTFGPGILQMNRACTEGLIARVRGDTAAARAAFTAARVEQEELTRNQPDNAPAMAILGLIDAGLGRKDDALRSGRRAVELMPVARDSINGALMIQNFATICAWVGEKDLALQQLEIATQIPGMLSYGQLKLLPEWDPLRGDPRFEAIVASLAPKEARVPAKSIAVLPFENLSSDKENAFFATGMQDEILTHLAKIADLKVISRTSVMSYNAGAGRNLREIGKQLGVAHLLEGSVQRDANRVRVNAQLIDARTDAHLWAQSYDRDLADMFAIQSEVAKAIAEQLEAKLSPSEQGALERPPTADVLAFDLYTRAKNLLLLSTGARSTEEKNIPQAVDLLSQAVARDPGFFLAHCLLVYAHDWSYFRSIDRTPARLAQAQAALEAAARLRPDAGETHLARAYHLYLGSLDYAGALAELEAARRTLPNEARIDALLGYIVRRQGKVEESLRYLERALEVDPRNFTNLTEVRGTFQMMRRYREAAVISDRTLSIYPDNLDARFARATLDKNWKADTSAYKRLVDELRQRNPAAFKERTQEVFTLSLIERDIAGAEAALINLEDKHANAGLVARLAGNEEKARAAYVAAREDQEKTVQAQPNSGPALALLAFYEAQLGQKEEALRDGRRAMELSPVEKDAVTGVRLITLFAITAARLGEKDLAVEHLAQAVQLPAGPHYGALKLDLEWDPLRGDPRFEKIVSSLAPK